jgi:predicted metal-dependent hydrolase
MTELSGDARFVEAIQAFNRGEFFEASDGFEELFFEAVRDEVAVVRALLQVSVGCLHVERRQKTAARGRLREALRAVDSITDSHGIAVDDLRASIVGLIAAIDGKAPLQWPTIVWIE